MNHKTTTHPHNGLNWTRNQIIAVGGMLILTVGVCTSLWYHLTHTAGAVSLEFVFLMTMTVLLILVSGLYALRLRWSYAAGIPVCLGFYIGLALALLEDVFFFTFSLYNVLVLLFLLIAVVVIIFSLRAMRNRHPKRWWHAGLAVLGVAVAAFGIVQVTNADVAQG